MDGTQQIEITHNGPPDDELLTLMAREGDLQKREAELSADRKHLHGEIKKHMKIKVWQRHLAEQDMSPEELLEDHQMLGRLLKLRRHPLADLPLFHDIVIQPVDVDDDEAVTAEFMEKAERLGFNAGLTGVNPKDDCPYQADTPAFQSWMKGFHTGHESRKGVNKLAKNAKAAREEEAARKRQKAEDCE